MQEKSIVWFKPDYCCMYIDNGDVNYTLMCWWNYTKNELTKQVICIPQLHMNTYPKHSFTVLFSHPHPFLPFSLSSSLLPASLSPVSHLHTCKCTYRHTYSQANVSFISINVPSILAWIFILLILGWMFYRYQLH